MKKEKIIFLLGLLVAASLLVSACTQSASTGEVTPQDDEDIQTILDAIENQPRVELTPTEGAASGDTGGTTDVQTTDVPTTEAPQADSPTATPTPTKEVVAVDLTVPNKYTLRKGEFPWCIARRFNIDAITLMNTNNLSQYVQYDPGLVLNIPQDAPKFQGNRSLTKHPATYTVKSGDTFYSIACVYGDVWPEEIAAQNFMQIGDPLPAGSQLDIP